MIPKLEVCLVTQCVSGRRDRRYICSYRALYRVEGLDLQTLEYGMSWVGFVSLTMVQI